MQIPNKIGILDSIQSSDSRLRFDQWEGYDSVLQRKYLALKINEILDFLSGHPAIDNSFSEQLKQEGDKLVHGHDWRLNQRFGNKATFDCKVCGETKQELIPQNQV